MTALGDVVNRAVLWYGDRTVMIDPYQNRELSYREFDALVDSYVAVLRGTLGLAPGDRVGIFQRNSHRWVAAEAAIARAGLASVALNIYLGPNDVQYLIEHAEIKAVLHGGVQVEILEQVRASMSTPPALVCVDEDVSDLPDWVRSVRDLGEQAGEPSKDWRPVVTGDWLHGIKYSSATKGIPKAVISTHEFMVGALTAKLANQLRGLADGDRLLVTTPLAHVSNGFLWSFLSTGNPTLLMEHYEPELFCEFAAQWQATHAIMAPTLIIDLVEYLTANPAALEKLRAANLKAIWYAGSPIPISVARKAEELLGQILNQQYGLTEVVGGYPAHGITELKSEWHLKKLGSCGRPIIGCTIEILDSDGNVLPVGELGEVAVLIESDGPGYWKLQDGQESAYQGQWLYTGDIGQFDSDGFLFLRDRKADMIISGGLNVYPVEVENVLATHPAVLHCSVVGMRHPRWIEAPWAAVVPRPGIDADEQSIIEFMRDNISHYKAPKRVMFFDTLPLNSNGKVLRRKLREEMTTRSGADKDSAPDTDQEASE